MMRYDVKVALTSEGTVVYSLIDVRSRICVLSCVQDLIATDTLLFTTSRDIYSKALVDILDEHSFSEYQGLALGNFMGTECSLKNNLNNEDMFGIPEYHVVTRRLTELEDCSAVDLSPLSELLDRKENTGLVAPCYDGIITSIGLKELFSCVSYETLDVEDYYDVGDVELFVSRDSCNVQAISWEVQLVSVRTETAGAGAAFKVCKITKSEFSVECRCPFSPLIALAVSSYIIYKRLDADFFCRD